MTPRQEAAGRRLGAAALRELRPEFPTGRRALRRFARSMFGGEIPDGPLAYRSRHEPLPLTELERMLVLSAMGGTTGWHYSITRHARYAPHMSNYAGGAAGRTFPVGGRLPHRRAVLHRRLGVYFFPTVTPARSSTRPPRT